MKRVSLNSEPCLPKSAIIDLNPDELLYYRSMFNLNNCRGNCNFLDDLFDRLHALNEIEDVNLKIFHKITWIKKSKLLVNHISYDCRSRQMVKNVIKSKIGKK